VLLDEMLPLSFEDVKHNTASLLIFIPFAVTYVRLQYKIILSKPSLMSPLLGSIVFLLCFPSIKLNFLSP